MKVQVVQSDVLIVGGGLAGIQAALSARRAGASVCMVLKGKLGSSGNSALASGGFAAALRLADREDSTDLHFADTMAGGGNLNDAALVRTMVDQAPAVMLELHRMGVAFAMSGDNLGQYQVPAQSYRRALRTAGGGALQMMRVLADAAREAGTRVVEGIILSDLLVHGGAAVGAIGLSREGGSPIAFPARAVVLACGGAGELFPVTSNHPEITGDGYAMAYRAGVSLADMEFVQFTPTALAHPPELRGVTPGGAILGQRGAKLLNRLGERFMERYDPQRMEGTTRAIASRAIYREIVEGRGTEHGGVYLDVTEVDRDALENISGPLLRRIRGHGVDPLKEPIELAPAVHHFMGGVLVDTRCRTDVPGLLAAGEATAGVHGANRLNSNALTEAAVFGAIAGREAAARAASTTGAPVADLWLEQAGADLEALVGPGESPGPFIDRLRTIMLAGAGLERRAGDLEAAISDLGRLSAEAATVGAPSAADIPAVIELRNMLQVGEMILKAALLRTESRGAHFRIDYPQQNDAEWLANIVVRQGTAGATFEVVPIRG